MESMDSFSSWMLLELWAVGNSDSCTSIYNAFQIILLISGWIQYLKESSSSTFWALGISKCYLYSIFRSTLQCHPTRIFHIPSFRFDLCQVWKIYIHSLHISPLVLLSVSKHDSSFSFPQSAQYPSWMDCRDGRSIEIMPF